MKKGKTQNTERIRKRVKIDRERKLERRKVFAVGRKNLDYLGMCFTKIEPMAISANPVF